MVLKVSIDGHMTLVGEFIVKELCGPLTLSQQACTESDNETNASCCWSVKEARAAARSHATDCRRTETDEFQVLGFWF